MKILVVDNTSENVLALEQVLSNLPDDLSATIVRAHSGEEALKKLLVAPVPVLALIDIHMPIMDGYALAENMRSNSKTKHIPIIFLSAIYGEDHYIRKAYGSGCVDFLTTPYNPDVLRAKVSVFLKLEKYRRDVELTRIRQQELFFEQMAEEEELQRKIYQAQKLESLGQLTHGVAHDFNNILASILGHTELSKMYLEDITTSKDKNLVDASIEDFRYSLSQITNSSERATDLIYKMLTYARQTKTSVPELIDVETISNEVVDLMKIIITPQITLTVTSLSEVPAVCISSPELHQVLTNLILNARDAIEYNHIHSGTIQLTLEFITVHSSCSDCHKLINGNFVCVNVMDSGVGIAFDKIPRVFEPFFTTKEQGKGTGLGLSVVSGIVHKANGHVIVTSEQNQGSIFQVLFPAAVENVLA